MYIMLNKDSVLGASLALSVVSLVLLFGVTWYLQTSLNLLQQEVENDRELLLELQEKIKTYKVYEDTIHTHELAKRQTDSECKCTGRPGPRGPTGKRGKKGDQGLKGPKGNKGNSGIRGLVGLQGPKGAKGYNGQKGTRGDPGERGPRGPIGDTGLRGPIGQAGEPGAKGAKGNEGPPGQKGDKGETGQKGSKGEMGYQGLKGVQGEKGSTGLPGTTGLTGSKGDPGQKGIKGDKEQRNTGTVYVRWGHNQCPSGADLVYSGRVGGTYYTHSGGGSNPQCLPMTPQFLSPISGSQSGTRAYMYGAEYQTITHVSNDYEMPCAVCYASERSTVYMLPARYSCPSGWNREYYGYLMTANYRHQRTMYTCIDSEFKTIGSKQDVNGMLFYFVIFKCGSLPCSSYGSSKELSCTVCSK